MDTSKNPQASWELLIQAEAELKIGNGAAAIERANSALRMISAAEEELFPLNGTTLPVNLATARRFVDKAKELVTAAAMGGPL